MSEVTKDDLNRVHERIDKMDNRVYELVDKFNEQNESHLVRHNQVMEAIASLNAKVPAAVQVHVSPCSDFVRLRGQFDAHLKEQEQAETARREDSTNKHRWVDTFCKVAALFSPAALVAWLWTVLHK